MEQNEQMKIIYNIEEDYFQTFLKPIFSFLEKENVEAERNKQGFTFYKIGTQDKCVYKNNKVILETHTTDHQKTYQVTFLGPTIKIEQTLKSHNQNTNNFAYNITSFFHTDTDSFTYTYETSLHHNQDPLLSYIEQRAIYINNEDALVHHFYEAGGKVIHDGFGKTKIKTPLRFSKNGMCIIPTHILYNDTAETEEKEKIKIIENKRKKKKMC